ncbi:SHOCT domain-containing protein [Paracraurococcus lichenis]|uniref:SHOCT domain-containing protein n=1 Tax=Paracraurococcus lichenis TaxID=3064888 RepID=A0ABT9E2Q9_9PROT|nr:SHOCT domain-containing protein [Paracraurococcus sp. LOR1-02]MDO9710453.1 SHOCT domain-containing protein [Paracraurococcus sp. LOR1-02]
MQDLTDTARRRLEEIAARQGVSPEAAGTLLRALAAGGGSMAQFSHPELGGMGQWSQGGMLMIGDMFNNALKARVDALAQDLAGLLREMPVFAPPAAPSAPGTGGQQQWQGGGGMGFAPSNWWPAELGAPASSGGQNDMRYAHFPEAGRLAVQQGGVTRLYDTGNLQIYGVSQQQGFGQSLRFSTSQGEVRLEDLRPLDAPGQQQQQPQEPPPAQGRAPAAPAAGGENPLAMLEKLGELHQRGILTDAEFAAKKAELLARL